MTTLASVSTGTIFSMNATFSSTGIQPSGAGNATTPSPSIPASPPARDHAGLSSGAIAGIVIGSVAAVALAAALLFWFFVRRRKRSKYQYAQAEQHVPDSREKGVSLSTVSPSEEVTASNDTLPQPLEDQAIIGHVSKISNAIKNHVQSYYHNDTGSIVVDHDDLRALGSDLPFSVETLTSLMENTSTREAALRFTIAWAVTSRMQPSKDSSKSLLPMETAQLYEKDTGKHPEFPCRPHITKLCTFANYTVVQLKSTTRWRKMTSKLSHSNYVHTPFDASDSRRAKIEDLLATLNRILEPFADPHMNSEERRRNLEEILKRAAFFAFTLFSQPSTYIFEWQKGQVMSAEELCIFPALMQVADETGQRVNPPRLFSEAVTRRIDL